jgi:hypothetical protein
MYFHKHYLSPSEAKGRWFDPSQPRHLTHLPFCLFRQLDHPSIPARVKTRMAVRVRKQPFPSLATI